MLCRNSDIENDITVAGADIKREFLVCGESGTPQNLTGASATWKLAPVRALALGSTAASLTANLTAALESGKTYPTLLALSLAGSETAELSGLYVQQITITDASGGVTRYQGRLQINPAII